MSWEKLTQDITFYAFFVASKIGKTGLTVTIDIWENTRGGTATEIVTAGSATEIGDGLYKYRLTSANVDAIGEYIAVFKTADSSVDQQQIPALWIVGRSGVENLDAAISSRNATTPPDSTAIQAASAAALAAYDAATGADVSAISVPSAADNADAVWDEALAGHATAGSAGAALTAAGGATDFLSVVVPGSYASGTAGHALGRIANGQLTIVQPVLDDGFFRIVPGRDYLAEDGMAITFSRSSWPTLPEGTTIEFLIGSETLDGERTGNQAVRLEVSAAQGTALAEARAGRQYYDIVATLPNGHVIALFEDAPMLVG